MASATKARLASSLTSRSSMEGWKAKSNCSKVRWKGQMGQPGTSGEVAFPAGGYLHAEQFGQHLGIGQLLAGRGVQGVIQNSPRPA